jgi:hypothetical protein
LTKTFLACISISSIAASMSQNFRPRKTSSPSYPTPAQSHSGSSEVGSPSDGIARQRMTKKDEVMTPSLSQCNGHEKAKPILYIVCCLTHTYSFFHPTTY